MITSKSPVLLNYFAVSNGKQLLIGGHVCLTGMRNFRFDKFNTLKTIHSLLKLYFVKAYSEQKLILNYGDQNLEIQTNSHGYFESTINHNRDFEELKSITVADNKKEVHIPPENFSLLTKEVNSTQLLISDIDDTVLETNISNNLKKLHSILFTKVERRKAVDDVFCWIQKFAEEGNQVCYVSNSEQNLYPIIYHFLRINGFPQGPLFLKYLRNWKDLLAGKKRPSGKKHKLNMLSKLACMFSHSEITLLGDNTQEDFSIYMELADRYPESIRRIIIREVLQNGKDKKKIIEARSWLKQKEIKLYYQPNIEALV